MRPIKHLFEVCFLLLTMSLLFALFGVLSYRPKPAPTNTEGAIVIVIPSNTPTPTPTSEPELVIPETIELNREFQRRIGQVELTCKELVLHNSYKVYFTAYCSEECGYRVYEDGTNNWPTGHITSTGTICHRSSELNRYEPSTCGVDPHYFPYGTMFYVPSEDRVYIAEDTGYISGAWIDTYQESMEEMLAYNVRYETIYTISLEYYTVLSSNYNVRNMILDQFREIKDA